MSNGNNDESRLASLENKVVEIEKKLEHNEQHVQRMTTLNAANMDRFERSINQMFGKLEGSIAEWNIDNKAN